MLKQSEMERLQDMADRHGVIWGIINGVPLTVNSWDGAIHAGGKLEWVAFPSWWKYAPKEKRCDESS